MSSFVTKIIGLFAALEPEDLDRLAPATRRKFAQICRYWADRAELPVARTSLPPPKSGVLAALHDGERTL